MVGEVPEDIPTVATFEFLPVLANRAELYSFHYAYLGSTILGGRTYSLPETVKYALVDFNDYHTFGWYYTPSGCDNIRKLLDERGFGVVDYVDSLVMFGKEASTDLWLYRVGSIATASNAVAADVAGDIRLLGWKTLGSKRSDVMDVTFQWECLRKTEQDIGACLRVMNAAGKTVATTYHPIGWRIYPTSKWSAGQIVEDRMRILNPGVGRGQTWELRMTFVDDRTDARCPITGGPDSKEVTIKLCDYLASNGE